MLQDEPEPEDLKQNETKLKQRKTKGLRLRKQLKLKGNLRNEDLPLLQAELEPGDLKT